MVGDTATIGGGTATVGKGLRSIRSEQQEDLQVAPREARKSHLLRALAVLWSLWIQDTVMSSHQGKIFTWDVCGPVAILGMG